MSRGATGLVAVVLVVVLLVGALGGGMMMGYSGVGPMPMFGGMGFGLGWLLTVALWVVIVVALATLVRTDGRGGRPETRETAEDVLRRRFAAGEIDREQYEEMRRVLRDEPPRAA